jgi:signal peptide peptidase SppA
LRYSRAASLFFDVPLALLPSKREEIRVFLESKLAGLDVAFDGEAEPFAAQLVPLALELDDVPEPESEAKKQGAIAVLPLRGTIGPRMNMMMHYSGGTSIEEFSEVFAKMAADPQIKAIVLSIDSPGGSSYGVTELSHQIMAARGKKPIVAVADTGMAASAAYWLGASCDQFFASPSSMVGSIGVWLMHMDESKYLEKEGLKVTLVSAGEHKTRGNPYEPLSEDDESFLQTLVNETYDQFIKDVALGRGVAPSVVRAGYGKGDVFNAATAKKMGMVDGVATLSEVIAKVGSQRPRPVAGQRAEVFAENGEESPLPNPLPEGDGIENEDDETDDDAEGQVRMDRFRLARMKAKAAAGAA